MPSAVPRKIFAIGDIHGCRDKLARLLEGLPYDPARDLLLFLGDYINRGPQSQEVIALLCSLRQSGSRMVTLMGNHEYLLLEYQKSADPALIPLLRTLQIERTLKSYGLKDLNALHGLIGLPEEHRRFFTELRPFYQTDTHIFVHAGLYPGMTLAQQDLATLTGIRNVFLGSDFDFGKIVVFGHSTFATPYLTKNRIGIDTGAAEGNLLTAVELPALVFHHA